MQLSEFLSHLTQHPMQELVFEFPHGSIRKDYHLTEVLRLRVDAMDCGGVMDHWSETVLQLVEPARPDGARFMQAGKMLAILTRSHERMDLDADSEVLLEYQSPDAMAAAQRFHVDRVETVDGQLRVVTRGASTQCKAADRSQTVCGSTTQASSCCAPAANRTANPASAATGTTRCCA
jgi:hypothetical protein